MPTPHPQIPKNFIRILVLQFVMNVVIVIDSTSSDEELQIIKKKALEIQEIIKIKNM